MCVKAAGNFLRNAQIVHTGAGRSQFQAYLLYQKNNFYCYRAEKAEDKVKQVKFELPGQNRFFSEHNEIE